MRRALVLSTGGYSDERLSPLPSSAFDSRAVSELLRDPERGHFDEVELIHDRGARDSMLAIDALFESASTDDEILLYFSGHGVRHGRTSILYFAFADTRRNRLRFTALSSPDLRALMESSDARRQLVILDCCYSGSISTSRVSKGEEHLEPLPDVFEGSACNVITSSNAYQPSFASERPEDQASFFTSHLIDGLRSGKADGGRTGFITAGDLYSFVRAQMKRASAETDFRQTPGYWASKLQEGEFLVSYSSYRNRARSRSCIFTIHLDESRTYEDDPTSFVSDALRNVTGDHQLTVETNLPSFTCAYRVVGTYRSYLVVLGMHQTGELEAALQAKPAEIVLDSRPGVQTRTYASKIVGTDIDTGEH